MSSLIKNIIVVVGLLALAATGYYFFVMEKEATLNSTSLGAGQGELETEEFLRRLDDLEKITLPTEMFGDPRFTSLKDFGSLLEVVPYGRETPFSSP